MGGIGRSHCLDPERPTVGIWFYQNFWTSNNKAHIDAIIRAAEAQDANVICVFHMRFKDKLLGNRGPDYVVEHFFMDKGQPVTDVLINPVMFSLKTAAPEYKGLLQRLGVPVIQAIATSRSIAEWQASDQGLNNVDITISVAQPELDGVIINEDLAEVENLLNDYQAARSQDQGKLNLLLNMIWEAATKADITRDLNLTKKDALTHAGDCNVFF